MKKLAAAVLFGLVLVLTATTAGANYVQATINCERWSFVFTQFPAGQDVPIHVAVQVPQGEGAIVSETIHTNGQVSGDAHGNYDVPVERTMILTVSWSIDGHPEPPVTAHTDGKCSPPEPTTTTTTSTTTTTVPPVPPTSPPPPPTVPPATTPPPTLPGSGMPDTGAFTDGLAVAGLMLTGAGGFCWYATRRSGKGA
jgi:hypothetical protein